MSQQVRRRPGDRVGKYILGRPLGHGSTGQVFAVQNLANPACVAKLINKVQLRAKGFNVRGVYEEIRTMKAISSMNGNFVKMVEDFDTPYEWVFILTRADGGSLWDFACYNTLDMEMLSQVVFPVAHGLSILHKNGYIHRDIKQENVLLLNEGQMSSAILADFGLATHYNLSRPHDSARGFSGSPDYMPPEACNNKAYGPAFDMWSLGILTLSCYNDEFPWDNCTERNKFPYLHEYIGQLKEGWYQKYMSKVKDRTARDFISRCLIVDATRRMTALEAVHHPFLRHEVEHTELPVLPPDDRPVGEQSVLGSVVGALKHTWSSIVGH